MNYTTSSFLLFFCILFFGGAVDGQKDSKPILSKFSVTATEGPGKGYFHHFDSTGLYYAASEVDLRQASTLQRIPVSSIQNISLRKKGGGKKGAVIGAVAGAVTGFLIGTLTGKKIEDCPTGLWSFSPCGKKDAGGLLAVAGGFLGAGVGALAGGAKVSYSIRGNKHQLRAQKEAIRKYEYRQ